VRKGEVMDEYMREHLVEIWAENGGSLAPIDWYPTLARIAFYKSPVLTLVLRSTHGHHNDSTDTNIPV